MVTTQLQTNRANFISCVAMCKVLGCCRTLSVDGRAGSITNKIAAAADVANPTRILSVALLYLGKGANGHGGSSDGIDGNGEKLEAVVWQKIQIAQVLDHQDITLTMGLIRDSI